MLKTMGKKLINYYFYLFIQYFFLEKVKGMRQDFGMNGKKDFHGLLRTIPMGKDVLYVILELLED